ncbi:MAG: N-acetyltransferase [Gemmatimonadetes bacterium]|nr:N-acetyltransferase [Gemmatimonadota bacterium]
MSEPVDAVDVRFERADASHVDVLAPLMRGFYAYEHLPWDEAAARGGLGMILADASLGQVWLMRTEEGWAGYFVLAFSFSLEFRGRFGFLDELYLRDDHRGRGLGRRAVDHAAEVCLGLGIRALRLEVTCDNAAARGFYARLGFQDHGRDLLTRWVD